MPYYIIVVLLSRLSQEPKAIEPNGILSSSPGLAKYSVASQLSVVLISTLEQITHATAASN